MNIYAIQSWSCYEWEDELLGLAFKGKEAAEEYLLKEGYKLKDEDGFYKKVGKEFFFAEIKALNLQ